MRYALTTIFGYYYFGTPNARYPCRTREHCLYFFYGECSFWVVPTAVGGIQSPTIFSPRRGLI